ncbi:hypothetical protein ACIOEX_05700 [Streptomyces sp. NPDC087850]
MWRDESVTYQVAHRSLPELVDLLRNADAVHGIYYFFMHGLFAVWDDSLIVLRLPSVLALAITAGLVGSIALRLTARPAAGLLSGLTFAVAPEIQMYAQEGRSYAMVCALVGLSTYLFVTLAQHTSRFRWFLYGVAMLAASILHEFAVLALLAHGITLYCSPAAPARNRRYFTLTATGVAVGLLPLIVFSMSQSGQVSWIGGPKPREWFEIVGIAALASACAWYLSRSGRAKSLSRLALPLTLAPTAALLLAAVYKHMYVDRYVLYTNIGFALLVGTTSVHLADRANQLSALRGTRVRMVIIAAGCLGATAALLPVTLQMRTPDSRKDNVTAIAREVERLSAEADTVLFTPARRREWMLSYPARFDGLSDIALKDSPSASGTLQGTELAAPDIRRRLAQTENVIVLSDPVGQPLDTSPEETTKRQILEHDFTVCARTELKGGHVTLYSRAPCPSATR